MACTLKLVKLFLILFNAAFIVIGVAVAAIAIWSIVEKIYVSDIIGTNLFAVASYMMILAGVVIIIAAILGFIALNKERKLFLIVYFFVQLVIFVLLIVGAILAVSFKGELEDSMKNAMTNTLTQKYGVESAATNAWDKVQNNLRCCAVVGKDWRLYQQTNWFANQHYLADKKFVPESCCVVDEYRSGEPTNLYNCQQWKLGPPTNPTTGMKNNYLYYEGCYFAARAFVMEHADIILAIGFGFGFFMIIGLALTVLMYRLLSKEEKDEEIKRRRQPDNL
ncbi:CD151 antigen-like [Gigantopelta aegis]|uniref:CD151 antigen-like n=1 Tax=Gigantopelta aegis TaxID=1735272 RepID=UPI001B888126|nr:CD151 antigen-like [Gigantopelta aegis]